MSRQLFKRREFLQVSALAAAGILAQACAKTPTEQPTATPKAAAPTATPKAAEPTATLKAAEPTATPKPPTATPKPPTPTPEPEVAKEAPALAAKVKSGALPSVDQRLPQEPLTIEPLEKLGQYGGTIVWMAVGDNPDALQLVDFNDGFAKYSREATTALRPNLCTSWKWNDTATELVLNMRKGVKWSDGQPLTMDDWIWWWENMVLDETVKYAPPTGTRVAGENMKLEKTDDYTVKLTFAGPNPLFMYSMNRGGGDRGSTFQILPAHAMEQFHPKFNTALAKDDVAKLRDHLTYRNRYADLPHFGPWVITAFTAGQKESLDRNAYYWKVDTEGSQLPYMDAMEVQCAASWELIITKIIAGEVDLDWQSLTKDWSVITENQAKGDYKTMMWSTLYTVSSGILFHYCFDDARWTKYPDGLLWQRPFRQAMSVAIDRERINEIAYSGLGRPRALAMSGVGAEFTSERGKKVLEAWENQDIKLDPELAKKNLDALGVVDKNGDGYREMPDGSALELIIDQDAANATDIKVMELVTEDFKAVGLKLTLNVIDGTQLSDRATNCQSMLRQRGGGASGLIAAPAHWTPVENTEYTVSGPPFGRWYQTGGKEGIAPPAGSFIEKLQKVYADAVKIVDDAKRNDRILDGYQIHVDEGPVQIGIVQLPNQLVVCKNNLHNVPTKGIWATWTFGWPGAGDPEQWWKS